MIAEGQKMPAISLRNDEGREVDTTSLLGAPLVLWFYPKDDTPG
jgi:thioredoxin-dependent peroxiredoxin